jgi:hypothetical protein
VVDGGPAFQGGEALLDFPSGLQTFEIRRPAPPRGEQAALVAFVSVDRFHRFHGCFFAFSLVSGSDSSGGGSKSQIRDKSKEMSSTDIPAGFHKHRDLRNLSSEGRKIPLPSAKGACSP